MQGNFTQIHVAIEEARASVILFDVARLCKTTQAGKARKYREDESAEPSGTNSKLAKRAI